MKNKLTLLATVIVAGIGATIAMAGADGSRPQTPASPKPAGMSCCAMGQKDRGQAADKDATPVGGMSCHSGGQAAKDSAPAPAKSCCK